MTRFRFRVWSGQGKFRTRFLTLFVIIFLLYPWYRISIRICCAQYTRINPLHVSSPTLFPTNEEKAKSDTGQTIPPLPVSVDDQDSTAPSHQYESIWVPFEEAVKHVTLQGWEDEWISSGVFNRSWAPLSEPKIDFLWSWVNGSDEAFQQIITEFKSKSSPTHSDDEKTAKFEAANGKNRFRTWDELRYSVRSVFEHTTQDLRNRIQILVHNNASLNGSISSSNPFQKPGWINDLGAKLENVEILPHNDFFSEEAKACAPTFNSATIESQIHNTKSNEDRILSFSDDMFLTDNHTASDIYSPLFGPSIRFKTDGYNAVRKPNINDIYRFGEKPSLYYTSWLLNRRFGIRKRLTIAHLPRSFSRSVSAEAMMSFPRPFLDSSCQRFQGTGFQLNTRYLVLYYTMERFREALLWSYIIMRSDINNDGLLDHQEQEMILTEINEGKKNKSSKIFRRYKMYEQVQKLTSQAGLQPPIASRETIWTSLDGPQTIKNTECANIEFSECFGLKDASTASREDLISREVFDQFSRRDRRCGDCLIKVLLSRANRGLSPLLPNDQIQRQVIVKALIRYQHRVVASNGLFIMVTNSLQVQNISERLLGQNQSDGNSIGQLCLNDDITTQSEDEIREIHSSMRNLFQTLFPKKSLLEEEILS